MPDADYAPPGFFAQHPLIQGFTLRDRFIGLNMDKFRDELVKAYQYEADTHGLVVKDGLNIHIQVACCAHNIHSCQCLASGGPKVGSQHAQGILFEYMCLLAAHWLHSG